MLVLQSASHFATQSAARLFRGTTIPVALSVGRSHDLERRLGKRLGLSMRLSPALPIRLAPVDSRQHHAGIDPTQDISAIFMSESNSESDSKCGFKPSSISFECFAL